MTENLLVDLVYSLPDKQSSPRIDVRFEASACVSEGIGIKHLLAQL